MLAQLCMPPPTSRVISSRDGSPTLEAAGESGSTTFFHSRRRPLEEARRQVEKLELGSNDSLCVVGAGLGYGVLAAIEKLPPTAFVLVIEKDPAILRLAMENVC